ncbi:MAG TPA: hypothetical protein VFQ30_05820 [Ktedonobacteraceae bacterium]|nr:hypothetical protein [Ktedonobacteraceae bacterium]
METLPTWRDLLARIIEDPLEKQRIANALGVNPITLVRWARGEASPHPKSLQRLLDAVPHYRASFLPLITEAFEEFSSTPPANVSPIGLSVTLYNHIFHLNSTIPDAQRFWSIGTAVLRGALEQLDPDHAGLQLSIMQCMAPAYGNTVRCLRERLALGTPPWSEEGEHWGGFFGAESLVGYALSTGHQQTIMNINEAPRLPNQLPEHTMSAVASPIWYLSRRAGCFLVVSTQPDYFRQSALLDLIESYTQLLILAFRPEDFYESERIELQVMPSFQIQQSYFSSLQQRIRALLQKATADQRSIGYNVAEQHALWQIEEELLQRKAPSSPER